MRIAVVQLILMGAGGAEKVLEEVLVRLAKKHQVGVFTLQREETQYPNLDSAVVFDYSGPPPRTRLLSSIVQRRRMIELKRSVFEWRPDVLVLNSPHTLQFTNWLSSNPAIPTVVYVHSPWELKRLVPPHRVRPPVRDALLGVYRESATPLGFVSEGWGETRLAICVSRAVERMVHDLNPRLRTAIAYNGVDHEYFRPTWEDENYALSVGRFSQQKNLSILVDALGGSDFRTILYGSLPSNELSPSSTLYFHQLRRTLSPNVTAEIHQDGETLRRRMQKCSVFLHPGKNEGFPLSPLEAMACGKVIVAHRSGGTPECVGSNGYLLGDDPKDWRSVIEELMASESRRKELGSKARTWSMNFTWEKTARSVESALETIA